MMNGLRKCGIDMHEVLLSHKEEQNYGIFR
jgi:hypothetical protein